MEKTGTFNKGNFFIRIILPSFLTITLFVAVSFALFIPHYENTIMDRKREMIRELTNSAWSIVDKWHKSEMQGVVPKEKAQEMAISQIEGMRYGEEAKDYFWITDYRPTMVMHPYRSELNNKDMANFTDSQGKKLFVAMAEKAKTSGSGFVDYTWQWKDDSTKIVAKLSYVKSFKPWQWIIGTGIYVEDVKKETALLEAKIINVSIGISMVISVLLFFIAYQNLRTEKLRMRAENDLQASKEKFQTLAEASSEGLIMVLEGGQIFYNKTLYHILGYEENTPLPDVAELFVIPPKLRSIDLQTLQLFVIENDESEQTETVARKADGTKLNVLLNISPIRLLNNDGVVLSLKDITVNKKIEAELDQSREKYLSLTNKLLIGVYSAQANADCHFIDSNSALLKLLEVSSEDELTSTSLRDYFENPLEYDSLYNDLHQQQSVQNRFSTLKKGNGAIFAASISAMLVHDENGKPLQIEGVVEDISEQNKTNENRDELINELQIAFLFLNNSIEGLIKPVTSCVYNAKVKDAIACMVNENSDCLLIEDHEGKPIGVFTGGDIRRRVLLQEQNLQKPVVEFMSAPLVTIPSYAAAFEALSQCYRYGITHILCRSAEGKIVGVISSRDVHKSLHASYLFFIQKIASAGTISELCDLHKQLMILIRGLIGKQADTKDITKLLSHIADTIVKRVIIMAEEKLGPAPVNYSYIVLGSSGREEQTLATDQDNAIVYADTDEETDKIARQYFLRLGEMVSMNLNQIGYDYCKGNIMASNPKWCQPVSKWKDNFTSWVTTALPQDLLEIKIFFDLRCVYGDEYLINELQDHITTLTAGYNSFFVYLAESIIQFQMPEGVLKLKSAFDIKMVMLPMVDAMRLYALKTKCTLTATSERMDNMYKNGAISKQAYKNIQYVYCFLMHKRLEHQSGLLAGNHKADNLINPMEFSDMEIVVLKKAMTIIEELQNKLKVDFRGSVTI